MVTPFELVPVTHTIVGETVVMDDEDDEVVEDEVVAAITIDAKREMQMNWIGSFISCAIVS